MVKSLLSITFFFNLNSYCKELQCNNNLCLCHRISDTKCIVFKLQNIIFLTCLYIFIFIVEIHYLNCWCIMGAEMQI